MLRQQDVGHRIVVRRIVGIREGRPLFADALGELVELNETHLTLTTRQGRLSVPLAEVHRAKRVPPARRPTAAAVIELELAADEAWPAPTRARLGDWLLRAADGWTGRANSALPVGDPDRPLPAALDAVTRWYDDLGQPAMVNTPLPLAAPVGAELDARSWGSRPPVLVQTVPLAGLLPDADTPNGDTPKAVPVGPPAVDRAVVEPAAAVDPAVVELAGVPSAQWLALAAGRKGGLPDAARHVLTAVDRVRFAHVHVAGELVAIGRGSVTGRGRWLGLSLIEVLPAARRQGLAVRLVRALAGWAAAEGATDAFLQVEQRNTAAVMLYAKLGFTTHHTYLTRVAPR
ncbi:Ribosomal protein S18 acetylase RimI and related acetyltransferases [Micromonospora nigra]|uniref:Ribosomal protein S18 acetylase RimI and related acetyltransferases n=1 Tax=Micromonospora nigra TaxID=145857 RepID=A0A1C6RQ36_9ACTN|nr:GNAT family N-acetyltransferase [Micromonospora nigra]SCL19270.1 Ribosomal protein S18 acetylase RimI and related acetyltransferases [Micromonospora nigra]